MITKTDSRGVQNGKELVRLAFKSTDNKPTTGIMNGSTGIEVNTGKKYVFDEESGEWTEIASSGGGGGGGGSSDFSTAEVTITNNSSEEIRLYLPVYFSHPEYGSFIQGAMMLPLDEPTFEGEVVIPTNGQLLVGASLAQFTAQNTTVTGNATVENGELIITGDCTITIS